MSDGDIEMPHQSPPEGFFHKKGKTKPSGSMEDAPWIVSFIDTLSLLLTFFVLLFSMSTLDNAIWQDVVNTFDSYFEDAHDIGNTGVPLDKAVPEILRERAINLDYLGRIIENQMRQRELKDQIIVQKLQDRLVLSVPSDFFFYQGRADLRPESRSIVVVLGSILRNVRNKIEIYGHTDPNPISTKEFPSNWELSIARAFTLRTQLRKLGMKRKVSVLGFSDAKFSELAKGIPQGEKFTLSRRVDIVIYPYVF